MSSAESPTPRQPSHRDDAIAVIYRLRESGHIAYLAGGCVRDMLLGIEPKDFDVATDAPPDRVRKLFSNTQAVGAKFGVILVRHGKSVIEVATFRTDIDYQDGRRPREVKFTTAEEDAQRRDFTINGLFFDPVANQVIDYVGGQADLKAKLLRAIDEPNHRFEEDHLRLLRAVRFAARFDLALDHATADAITRHASALMRISPERIADELRLMLTPPTRTQARSMLQDHGLDRVVFRFLQFPWQAPHPEVSGQRPTIIFDRVMPDQAVPFGLAIAAATLEYALQRLPHLAEWPRLLDEITIRQMTRAVRQALRLSNEENDGMADTLYGLEFLVRSPMPPIAKLKRFLARSTANFSRAMLQAIPEDAIDLQHRAAINQKLNELAQTEFAPPPLVTGDDLTAQGLQPGKLFKRVLDDTYDAQLEARVTDKPQAMAFALELAKREAS